MCIRDRGCAAGPAKTEEPNSSSSSMSVPSESESSAPPAETEERPEEPEGSASEESEASSSGQSAVPAGPATTQELFAEGYPEAQELLENMTLEEKVAQVFPVSYTHLDVYKRQRFHLSVRREAKGAEEQ